MTKNYFCSGKNFILVISIGMIVKERTRQPFLALLQILLQELFSKYMCKYFCKNCGDVEKHISAEGERF